MVDERTLRKHIGHLIGMQQFRHYTKGTMGQCMLNFWCDAEKFRRHTPPELRRFVFREIQYQYLKSGCAYEVPNTIKSCIFGDGKNGQGNNVSIFSEDIFVSAQSLVVANLYSYWVPKYILHKCRELATTYQQRRLSRAVMAKHLLRDISPKLNYNRDSETAEKRTNSNPLFESIDEDEEFEKEKNIFFETNRVSSTESDGVGRRSRSDSPFLPDIKSTGTMLSGFVPEPKEGIRRDSFKLPELCPSFNNSMASENETERFSNRRLNRRNVRQFNIKEFLKPAMPYAMLENDDSRKTPKTLKKYKKAADQSSLDNVLLAVDKASATNIVQIIKPTYHEEIPKKPLSAYQCMSIMGNSELCAPIKSSSDERRLLLASVMSDRLAGGPLRNYLKCNGNTTALANLQFWEDVQIYVAVSYSSAADLKFRRGRNLLVTYLQPESVREVQLEPGVREKVCQLVRRGQADMLLRKVADQILECLYEPWKNFVEADQENLFTVLEQTFKRKISLDEPGDSLKCGYQGEVSFRMYRALDLALCLVQGEFEAIDVEEEEEVTSESDGDDEDEDDGSLRKRRLTIVNEEAAVALALGTEGRGLDPNARRKSHFYGKISRRSRKSSLFNSAAFKTRPPKPRKFLDILTDSVQLLWLKRFLMEHGAIIPLKFWQDVEKMKTQSKDSRARQTKARVIVKSYFANIDDPSRNLQCRADIIKEIPRIDHVTPAMLVSAQACVIRSLEEQWFGRYLSTFPEDAKEEDTSKYAARNTLLGVAKIASRGKTRGLWALFGHSMMTFIRGVTKAESCSEFMKFLVNESIAPVEGRKNVSNGPRRIINNRVIFADRLSNDLMFWLEVQRFKLICDGASACAMAGNYTIDDEILVRNKAKTILDCYIESMLPPKVQINITQEIVDAISHLWCAGIIDRGMFHDAEIYLFCILINYWKKFLAREPTSGTDLGKGNEKKSKKKSKKKIEKQMLYLDDIPYRKVALGADEEPKISFSLATGLRIIS